MRWNEYYYKLASLASEKSRDSTKVGAILVGPEGEVRLTGFNGIPRGVYDTIDRLQRPKKYLYASHAEANLIAFAAREGIRTKNCTVYTTHKPCAACARTLIQAGISKVVYGPGTFQALDAESETTDTMFREAGVLVEAMEDV